MHHTCEALDCGFQNVRTRGASEWQTYVAVLHANSNLILRAGEGQAHSLFSDQQRTNRQFRRLVPRLVKAPSTFRGPARQPT